jgi:hypothetical protein
VEGGTKMIDLEYIRVEKIEVYGAKGTTADVCIREAIKLAVDEDVEVWMKFNNDWYIVTPQSVYTTVKKKKKKND